MKLIMISLWQNYERVITFSMPITGRVDYHLVEGLVFDRLTIEPDDPDSKVEFTHYGAKYTP